MVDQKTLEKAVAVYNEYRRPMASATLVDHTGRTFTVRFEGPFCRTCCDYDYYEDLVYELAAFGEDPDGMHITDISYEGDETFLVGFAGAH